MTDLCDIVRADPSRVLCAIDFGNVNHWYAPLGLEADFAYLLETLKAHGKRTILVRGRYIARTLRQAADVILDARDLRHYITRQPR